MKSIRFIISINILIPISSCVHLVSYYDSVSYKNLTDLKAEASIFFESCKKEIAKGSEDLEIIDGFVLSSAKAYEYEKGKQLNDDTISQLEIIKNTINEVKARYSTNIYDEGSNSFSKCKANIDDYNPSSGCLTTGYCIAKWKVLEIAFDIAIETEGKKLNQ